MDFIEEPLWLVQRVRARPRPPTEEHKQVLVDHEGGPSLGRGVRTWAGDREGGRLGKPRSNTATELCIGFPEVRQQGDSTFFFFF